MKKSLIVLIIVAGLFVGSAGCAIQTNGEASWEAYFGVRTKQHSDEPAQVKVESSVVDKIVDSLTDGKVSEAE